MLIPSRRHTEADLSLWAELEEADRLHGQYRLPKLVPRALWEIETFARNGERYCSVSWGKDSTALADLVMQSAPETPLVWVRVEPIFNPDCELVRDAFLQRRPSAAYREITTHCTLDAGHEHTKRIRWIAGGTLESGFKSATEQFGERRFSGVRADESGQRQLSARTHGVSTAISCRPLLYWSAQDVYAYLRSRNLPVHPAYAMLGGGRYDRSHVRVSSLGGMRGRGMGRDEWEQEYYGDVLRRLETVP